MKRLIPLLVGFLLLGIAVDRVLFHYELRTAGVTIAPKNTPASGDSSSKLMNANDVTTTPIAAGSANNTGATGGAATAANTTSAPGALSADAPAASAPSSSAPENAGAAAPGRSPGAEPASEHKNAAGELTISHISLKAEADLGQIKITYHITPAARSADATMQIFVHRDDIKNHQQWDTLYGVDEKGRGVVLSLYQDMDNTGVFYLPATRGTYGQVRLLLFSAPGGKSIYDSSADPKKPALAFNVSIVTKEKRIVAPTLHVGQAGTPIDNGNGTYTISIPAEVRYPADYTIPGGGMWAMAKGEGPIFSQTWAGAKKAQDGTDANDKYKVIPVTFVAKTVKPGLHNVQFGLFSNNWGKPLEWIFPGMDIEFGGDSWVVKAPLDHIPPRVRVRRNHFETLGGSDHDFYAGKPEARRAATFVRGGNYGNAIVWSAKPALNRPGYFSLLRGIGCKFMRFNFNGDRFIDDASYRHAVDQIVQNIWAAGLYPLIAPQDLPKGDTMDARIARGRELMRVMATTYRGKSIWLEVCNEPKEFASWSAWKPVAVEYAKVIRSIDPEAFVVVPFENYSKDGRGAAKDPIRDVQVDLYDGHAYVKPEEVAMLFGAPVKAGLPVLIGEYGGGPDYLARIDAALQNVPGLMASGPWAFTIKGQDSLPLVASGATANLVLTPAGQKIADDYAAWDAGRKIP